jgi:SAM-dependent methyltransferase
MGITNVEFRHADIETLALSALGRFDVVLCAGVLYHVPAPWNLISRIASVSKNVYVCTHYSEVKRANVIIRGYRGRMYREPPLDNPQAGLSRFSFWPTLSSLLDMFRAYGFKTIHVIDDNPKFRNGPYVTLAASAP